MGFYYQVQDVQVKIMNVSAAAAILRKDKEYAAIDQSLSDRDFIDMVAYQVKYHVSEPDASGVLVVIDPFDQIKGEDGTDWIKKIATHIQDGSYVQVTNDDDDVYRVVFYDGQYTILHPIWPDQALKQFNKEC